MWNIISVTTATGSGSCILFGGEPGKEIVGPTGLLPHTGTYVLAFPGLGYIKFIDKGNGVRGPGDWSVQVSGSSTNWFYRGDGKASVSVNESGEYTMSGECNTISGPLTPF